MNRSFHIRFIIILLLAAFGNSLPAQVATGKAMQVAYVDGFYFSDPKLGVKKYMDVGKKVEMEYKVKIDEVTALQKKLDELKKVLEAPGGTKTQSKYDEYDNLNRSLLRKREDYEAQYKRRYEELLKPVNAAITIAMKQWCKQKGYDVLIDISKDDRGYFLYVDEEKIDATTKDLINHLNLVL